MSKINRNHNFLFLLTLILLLAIPFSARASELNQVSEDQAAIAGGPLIAVILPLSGPFAEYGKTLKQGYEQGFSAATGTTAPQYRVKYLDSQANPETARNLINLLSSEGEVAIATGTPLNATAWTVSRACEKNSIPYLIVGADQDNLINRESVSTFRLTPKHSALKQMLTRFIAAQKPGIKSMGIIYDNSICAIKKARQLRALCAAKNIDLSIWKQWQTSNNNRDNFYDLLNAVKERRPEILFLVANPTLTNRLWQQGHRLGIMPEATIAIPTGTLTPTPNAAPAADQQNSAASKLIYATPWINPGNNSANGENLSAANNPLAAAGSAAAAVIINCLEKSLNLTAEEISKSMKATRIDTIYGTVNFTTEQSGHQNPAPWNLCRNDENGQIEIIFPKR